MLTDRRGFIGGLLALLALPKAWRPAEEPRLLLEALVDEYGTIGPFVSRTTYPKLPRITEAHYTFYDANTGRKTPVRPR